MTGPGPPADGEAAAVETLFGGPGLARAAHRAVDWARTPLGPVREWPASLRTMARTVLACRFPMILFWGPDYVQIYNDAFTPSLGSKAAAGVPGRDTWAEIWNFVRDQFEAVRDTGVAAYNDDLLIEMNRRGFDEETYFTYSYSPAYGDDGAFAGILCTTTETTERVLAQRRLDTLSVLGAAGAGAQSMSAACEQAADALGHNPHDVPFALLYLVDERAAELAGSTGLAAGDPAAPGRVELGGPDDVWSLADVVDGHAAVRLDDLVERFPGLHAGPWPERPTSALLLPLRPVVDGQPSGVLVAGVSARLALDARYREFLELVSTRVVASLGDAHSRDTERRRIEMMTELDRAKTEFFANVSHEFRTPLTLILGPLDQLRRSVREPELQAELDTVHRNGLRLGKLVNSLLDFSRVEAGRADARFEPTDLTALTEELASVFRSAMTRAGLIYEVDCERLDEPVYLDRSLWEKIILNLLSNALKYTRAGSVRVRLRRAAGAAVLSVEDTGVGIPTSEAGRLFERFHRIGQAGARSSEGSGIGLALCRKLAELHGGTLTAVSTVGKGSTFTVTIPLGRGHLPAEQVIPGTVAAGTESADPASTAEGFVAEALRWLPDERDPADLPQPSSDGGRVLVVDDNADMRDYLRRLLGASYRVRLFGNGRTALEAARADPPDLVLSDVMLPDLDGISLVRALRADPVTAQIPVVLLSARADQQAAADGLAAGADDYLVKPFAADELMARLNSHLRLGRARRDAELSFRAMADATPTMIWVDGPGMQRVFVNRAWAEFVGGDPVADQATGWHRHVHPDDLPGYLDARARAEALGVPFETEYRLRRADDRYRWVLDRGAPVADRTQPGGYVGGCVDIDTKHREAYRQRVLDALTGAMAQSLTLDECRFALAETLVAEGLVDLVRLIDVDETRQVAYATRVEEHKELLTHLRGPWTYGSAALANGVPTLHEVNEEFLAESSPDPDQVRVRTALGLNSVALIPLIARGRVAGLLGCGRTSSSPKLDTNDFELLVEVGDRAAIALDNALLLEQEQLSRRRLELLQRATAALSAAATPPQVAEAAVTEFGRLLDTPAIAVFEVREPGSLDALHLGGWAMPVQADWTTLPIDSATPAATAARERRPVWLEDYADWMRLYPRLAPLMVQQYGYPTFAVLPLLAARGSCLGVICIGFQQERRLTAAERDAALALADLCAQALQRAGLLAAENQARRAAEDLGKVVSGLSRATTPTEVGEVILEYAAELGATGAVVALRDGATLEVLVTSISSETERMSLDAAHPLAYSARSGLPVWLANRSTRAWEADGFDSNQLNLPVEVSVPLVIGWSVVGSLGLQFADGTSVTDAATRSTVCTVAGQCAQALDRARLYQAEHEVAEVLQRSLLPHRLPELARLTAATCYLPAASKAGGDWYDLLPSGDTRIAIAVGDVVGHGAPAAAVMGQLRSALASTLLEGHSPAAALEQLDRFARRVEGALGTTCACLTLDWATGRLSYASAGHPSILLLEPSGPRFLDDARSTVLGVRGRAPFVQASTVIEPGTTVLLYTDGLVERRQETLGNSLERLARAAAPLASCEPDALVRGLVERMLHEQAPADDVAVVAVRLLPEPLRARVPATADTPDVVRDAATRWAAVSALPAELVADLRRGLGDAVAQVIARIGPDTGGQIEYEVTRTDDGGLDVAVHGGGPTIRFAVGPPGAAGEEPQRQVPAPRPAPGPMLEDVVTGGRGEERVWSVVGDLTSDTVQSARVSVRELLGTAGDLVIDLREAGYMGSAAVSFLAESVGEARRLGTQLSVRVARGSFAERAIDVSGLSDILDIEWV